MYKSPIEIFCENTLKDIVKQQDDYIFQEVQRIGVSVDKDELIRALQYDREQYEKGYADGKADAVVHGRWELTGNAEMTCSVCGDKYYGEWDYECMTPYCSNCGSKMDRERRTKDG